MKTLNNIIIIIYILTYKGTKADEAFTIKKLDNSGIFFEKISTAIFYNKQIDLITEINIPETRQVTATLMDCNNHLTTLCDEIIKEEPGDLCKSIGKEIQWHINHIRIQNNKLQTMYGKQKRGLLDVGGKISKLVFGTMDSEDADTIYESLQDLQFKQAKIMELEDKHIAILKSKFDALSKPIMELQNETFEIEEKLNKLIQQSDNQKQTNRRQQINHQVTELSSLVMIQCLHINKLQEDASEIITSLENAKLNPLVFPLNKIVNIIETTNTETNDKLRQHQILRQIIEITYTEIDGKLIIKATIPKIEKNEYTLYKPYLIPFKNQKEYQTYEIEAEYIAIEKEKDRSIELHTWDIEKCKQINDDIETQIKICRHSQPIISTGSQHCLPNLFVNPLNAKNQCKTIPARPPNKFTKLTAINTWLFTLNEKTSMIIECRNTTQTIQIKENGLITFLTSCRITTKDFVAEVTGIAKQIKIEQTLINESNESIQLQKIPEINNSIEQNKIELINHRNHNRDFLDETRRINDLKKMAEKVTEQRRQIYSHKITNTTISITGVTIVIISIVTAIICKRRNKEHTISKPLKIEIHNEEAQNRKNNIEVKPQGPRVI